MKIFNKNKGVKKEAKNGAFSDFFLHASESKRREILREAAQGANEDQREVFRKFSTKNA